MSAVQQQPRSRRTSSQRAKSRGRTRSKPKTTAQQRAPRQTTTTRTPLTRAYPGRHLGPLPLTPVVAWQVALGVLVIGLAADHVVTSIVGGAAVVLVAVLTLVPAGGRPLWRWLRVWRAARSRAKKAGPALPHDPSLVPLREWLPELELASVAGKRGADEVGVLYDGLGYTVLLGPDREDLIASADPVTIPLAALASVGEAEGVRLTSAQLVVQTQPAPVAALGNFGGHLAASYTEINTEAAPASVSWWIALRLEPSRDGTALTLDGEDAEAVRRALRTIVAWATKVLSSSGLPSRPLAKSEVREVLALTLGVDPHHRPTSLKARRTAESWKLWTCDGASHITGWVRSWPRAGLPGMSKLLAAMAGLPVRASTASLAVSWAPDETLHWSGYVRVAADNPKVARAAYRQLAKQAGRAKVGVSRLDGEQLPGVLATIPLGGGA
ncbi:MAG TPA: type VII secretion protein EccE [Actinopolymorphaceae bacterium]